MKRDNLLKRYFFFKKNIHATSLYTSGKNLASTRSKSIEIFRAPVQQVFGTNLDYRGSPWYTRVQYARAYASRGRAWLVSTSGHRFKAGQSTLYRTSPSRCSRRYVRMYVSSCMISKDKRFPQSRLFINTCRSRQDLKSERGEGRERNQIRRKIFERNFTILLSPSPIRKSTSRKQEIRRLLYDCLSPLCLLKKM